MLKALIKSTNKKISYEGPYKNAHEVRKAVAKDDLICPYCEEPVFPRKRFNSKLHFVHHSQFCSSSIARHPESAEHEQGKLEILEYLKQHLDGIKFEVEYHLPKCGKNGRIADVAAIYDNGNLLIAECQIAKITVNELEKRTNDYYAIGADVLWFIGRDADTPENRQWLRTMFGAVGLIEFVYARN